MKEDDGCFKCIRSPTWIHSDIMDDNIHMKKCSPDDLLHDTCDQADGGSTMNGLNDPSDRKVVNWTLDTCNGETNLRRWCPSHLLDFSNLSVGDPLYDLIPIYLDVFRGETCLLNKLLKSYKLPLITITTNDAPSDKLAENYMCKSLSYRATCYCILHEDNVLGAIFSLWKELRAAKSWEEVEEAVWGELNSYQH
ncbi:F-box protein [Platanthera guangdongensis]|uniref:F-box protein n=1 Tax=Platanthera guangdongensis TaxID=2320717 RepID=A0ABR2MTA1_9ASPA